jgi:hypothetical protein
MRLLAWETGLSRITEDDTGIWELLDEAKSQLSQRSVEERMDVARAALSLLLAKGFVRARRGRAFADGEELDRTNAGTAIEDVIAWRSPRWGDGVT